MIKNYYLLLKQRLEAALPDVKEINLYAGQLEQDGKVVLAVVPSVFIEFSPATFEDELEGVQRTSMQFSVYAVSEALYQDDRKYLDPNINHLELCEEIHKALHRYGALLSDLPPYASLKGTPEDCTIINKLRRTSFEPITIPNSNLLATIQVFEGLFVDLTAVTNLTEAVINALEIAVEVKDKL